MNGESEVSYTRREILDYLPGGWVLSDPENGGAFNDRRQCWEVNLRDIADVEWELQIEDKAVRERGRVEALRAAIEDLYKAALGSPGFFG